MQVFIRSTSLCFIKSAYNNGDNEALFLPKAGRAFLIVTALKCFSLTSSITVKNHTKAKM